LVKNDRIEVKCSTEVRTAFEIMATELSSKLRKKLGRRVYSEDVIKVIINAYKRDPRLFEDLTAETARIR